jgi:hypothetical protein
MELDLRLACTAGVVAAFFSRHIFMICEIRSVGSIN